MTNQMASANSRPHAVLTRTFAKPRTIPTLTVQATISFACPACFVKLTVPGTLAGVVGPCPSCGTSIQAPFPESQAVNTPPVQVQPVYEPPASPAPVVLKPEPRQLPQRAHSGEVSAKPIPATSQAPPYEPAPSRRRRTRSPLRILVPLLFVITCIGVIAGTVILMKRDTDIAAMPLFPKPAAPPSSLPEENQAASPAGIEIASLHAVPFPSAADTEDLIQPQDFPVQPEPEAPGIIALRTLEQFLAAKSLEERLPLIESRTPEDQLVESVLAGPLPPTPRIYTDIQEPDTVEQLIDVYFNVDFDLGQGVINPQTLLVRIRTGEEPKVVIDPFLDLYGGRLLAYANEPSQRGGVFRVIAWAGAFCNEEHVPNREKKLTLRLMARDGAREICQAYFNRLSKIGKMLQDDTSGLYYGQARPCTVMLRWNTEEDPKNPYLEAIDIKSLNWNP